MPWDEGKLLRGGFLMYVTLFGFFCFPGHVSFFSPSFVRIQILLSSGAHLSRYLVQIAAHHYFYTQAHFIKTHWVRHVPLAVMSHFLELAAKRYGDISFAKVSICGLV